MLYNNWWKNAGRCSGDEKSGSEKKAHSLGVANVGGTFVILVAGLALAAVVAMIEFLWYNTTKRTRVASQDRDNQVYNRLQRLALNVKRLPVFILRI